MATMAGLLVQVGADIGDYVSGMTKLEAVSAKATRNIKKEFSSLAGNLATVLGGAAVVSFVKSTLDMQEAVLKLGQKTGIAVEQLSALRYAADQSDVSLEGIAKGAKKLSENMVAATDATSDTAALFKLLGVDIKGGTLPAMLKMADTFAALPDGPTKAALAVKMFGKAGMDMIPLLNQGSEGIRKMMKDAEDLGVTFTKDSAKAAEDFNDSLKRLAMTKEKFVTQIMPPFIKALNDALTAFIEANKQGNLYEATIAGVSKIFESFKGIEWTDKLADTTSQLALQRKELERMKGLPFFFKEGDIKRQEQWIADLVAQRDMYERAIHGQGIEEQNRRALAGLKPKGKGVNEGAIAGLLSGASTKGAVGADLLVKLEQDYAQLNNTRKEGTVLEKTLFELQKEAYKKIDPLMKQRIIDQAKLNDTKLEELQVEKMLAEAHEKDVEFAEARGNALEDMANSWEEATENMQLEAKLLGMSNVDRQKALLLEKARLDMIAAADSPAAMKAISDNLRIQLDLLDQMEQKSSALNVWNELADRAAEFAVALLNGPKKALESLRASVKQLLIEMVAVFAKRWVLQMLAGATGSAALASQAAQVGQGTLSGTLSNGLSSWLGLGATATSFGTGFSAGFSGAAAVPMAEYAIPALGSTSGSFGATLGAMAANPVTWIVAAAVAAVLIMRSREGGPKEGGSFFGTYDAQGRFVGTAPVPGTDNGRFFTPSSQDALMRQMTNSFASGFQTTLERLGGTRSGMSFGLGTDQDPRGSAANRVMGAIYRDGMQVFHSLMTAGRDDEDLQRAFSLTMSRMLLAGLQASNLPAGVAQILNTVSASTGTEEEIKKVIELATAFGDLMQVISDPFTSSGIIAMASKSATDLLEEQGAALVELASKTEMTTEDLQRLTQGTVEFRNAAATLVLALHSLKKQAEDTIDGLLQTVALAGMTPQQQFDYWQSEANRLFSEMMASNDPAEIERLMGQWTTAWNNAWSMLTPEQQAAEGPTWAARLTVARNLISTHINTLIEGIVTDTNTVLTTVGTKMDQAADKYVAAATTQSTAADKFAAAVSVGVKVSIIIDQYGNYIVTDAGGGA